MPDWTIRSATCKDIAAVLELWHAAGAHPAVGSHREGLGRLLSSDAEALLLAEAPAAEAAASQGAAAAGAAARERRLVGSLIAVWDGWRGSFYRLAVHPEHRREGLGTALVREGERRLRAHQAERFTAIVADEDAGAREFWAAAGYRRQPDRERFVRELSR
ncbi:MAG TPA: GNAT family N-acetyltransferase [Solirubrobacteraceae bacterium]|nr:GNAT family N-acetyltransferase [Solirubrobacteraceae bacterium]